ncbi:flagellar motor protein MotB [Gorillibacterium timonense]|uniref:flagellar motor protein MotB n=1 Tax=Gorillibacterium timonense TaxID=1689269 RepID=UPI00071E3DC2|nr:flagellar motor protein MotB [Gorillibacterium timonense]
MARRNKKKQVEHENNERWLVTYSDLITLLLVFFVIMYSMSKVDVAKYNQLAQSLQFQFNKSDSVMPQGGGGSGLVGETDPKKDQTADNDSDDSKKKAGDETRADQERKEQEQKEQELQGLLKIITHYIDDNKLQATVSAVDTERGVSVTLKDYFLFDLGKADLKPGAYPILDKMASLFPSLHAEISIEGHTDDLPITGGQYQDNWRLSSERSLSVLRYFEKKGISRDILRSVSYADTKPIVKNDSEANRQKNRRVEIVVLR